MMVGFKDKWKHLVNNSTEIVIQMHTESYSLISGQKYPMAC